MIRKRNNTRKGNTMNIQFTKSILKTIGGALILITLMSVGFFFYARWDLKRFQESLGELPEVSPMIVSQTVKKANTYAEEAASAEIAASKTLTQHNIELESEGLEMETPSLETLNALIDELSLSEVGNWEEDTANIQSESFEEKEITQSDKFQEDTDSGSGFASLISTLESGIDIGSGDPEDVATVVEILKHSAKGPVTVDDLITMTEAWLRIQPDTPHVQSGIDETRDSLTNLLSQLRADKEKSLQSGEETKRILYIQ